MKFPFAFALIPALLLTMGASDGLAKEAEAVLVIQDERPQIDVLSAFLRERGGLRCEVVDQRHIPKDLSPYKAVIMFVHGRLHEPAEVAAIDYCKSGGRLIVLHHSISSSRRKNKFWLKFLGIQLKTGKLEDGAYAWRHDATFDIVNLDPTHYITTHKVNWPETVSYTPSDVPRVENTYSAIRLTDSEVYLNHRFTDGREKTVLCGFKYTDEKSGTTFMQDRAAWLKRSGKGYVVYFLPGHIVADYQNPNVARMILNAILWQQTAGPDIKAEFLKLCDVACEELNKQKRSVYLKRRPMYFYEESYAIRALAVAYDMTGSEKYLDTCKRWSDRMVGFQSKMTPKGAYYMNYGRKPGEDKGGWYVADSSSIAMGVLATAVRCGDRADSDRYLDSVESFAKLVMDNYVGDGGGITDGLWEKYDGQWWCSSGLFGSLAFLLYDRTGDEQYLEAALGALDWLNRLDFTKVKHISFEKAAPSVIMYIFEAYAAGIGHLKADTERRRATLANISKALKWMSENQTGRRGRRRWDYNSQWGSKLGGLPFHMYVYWRHVPEYRDLNAAADEELRHISSLLFKDDNPPLSQLVVFAMMSYAEKLSPGVVYRKSGPCPGH